MKRYLLLGTAELDITWLEMNLRGHVKTRQTVPVRIYKEMPLGFTGLMKELTINATFAPMTFYISSDQWLPIISATKLPADFLTVTIP